MKVDFIKKLLLLVLLSLACHQSYNKKPLIKAVAGNHLRGKAISTGHDTIPDFCTNSNIQTVASGSWSDPNIWSLGRVPLAGDRVIISTGTMVNYDLVSDASLLNLCIETGATLSFVHDRNTKIVVANFMVMDGGYLEVGTDISPIPPSFKAEIVIANRPIDLISDPDQFGTGLIAMGKVRMFGSVKSPTFLRLTQEPKVGQTFLVLEQAVGGWSVGDRIVLPDTRHMKWNEVTDWHPTSPQWEEFTIQSMSTDNKTINLSSPLQFDHLGARDGDGAIVFMPHVANLTRNVVIRSENPSGVRGHTMFTMRPDVDIRYVWFKDLGRTTTGALDPSTNHIGRYSLHMHHVAGPTTPQSNSYQYTLIGNSLDGGSLANNFKWAMTIHDSHYGFISDNVAYNFGGALYAFEDGSESFNLVNHNFGMRTWGVGGRMEEGTGGTAFWFRGPNNYVRNNVATNVWGNVTEAAYGFKFFCRYLGNINVPNFKGADTLVPSQFTTRDGNNMPILEFSGNEVYAAAQGLTYWWINSLDPQFYPTTFTSTILNLNLWHVFNVGIYHYPSANITIDGLRVIGKDPVNATCCGKAYWGTDYSAKDLVIRNSNVQGMLKGIEWTTFGWNAMVLENSYFRNQLDLALDMLYCANGGTRLPPRMVTVRNSRFDAWPGVSHSSIGKFWDAGGDPYQSNFTQSDNIYVYGYQNNPTDNFAVYYSEQATQNIAGGIAPCSSTRPEINGLVCGIAPEANPSAVPSVTPAPTPSGTAVPTATPTPTSGRSPTAAPTTTPTPTPVPSPTAVPTPTPTPDLQAPIVTITNPLNRSSVTHNSTLSIKAQATDYVGVTQMKVFVDGALKCQSISTPIACSWRVPSKPGPHTIVVHALDEAGNDGQATSSVTGR